MSSHNIVDKLFPDTKSWNVPTTAINHMHLDVVKEHNQYAQMIIDHYAAKGEIPPCTRIGSDIDVRETT